jgi:hypothetical protein
VLLGVRPQSKAHALNHYAKIGDQRIPGYAEGVRSLLPGSDLGAENKFKALKLGEA